MPCGPTGKCLFTTSKFRLSWSTLIPSSVEKKKKLMCPEPPTLISRFLTDVNEGRIDPECTRDTPELQMDTSVFTLKIKERSTQTGQASTTSYQKHPRRLLDWQASQHVGCASSASQCGTHTRPGSNIRHQATFYMSFGGVWGFAVPCARGGHFVGVRPTTTHVETLILGRCVRDQLMTGRLTSEPFVGTDFKEISRTCSWSCRTVLLEMHHGGSLCANQGLTALTLQSDDPWPPPGFSRMPGKFALHLHMGDSLFQMNQEIGVVLVMPVSGLCRHTVTWCDCGQSLLLVYCDCVCGQTTTSTRQRERGKDHDLTNDITLG